MLHSISHNIINAQLEHRCMSNQEENKMKRKKEKVAQAQPQGHKQVL